MLNVLHLVLVLWLALGETAEWKCPADCSVPLGSVMLPSWLDLGHQQGATAKPPVAAATALQVAGALQGPLGLQVGGAQTTPLGPLSSPALNRCASSCMSSCNHPFCHACSTCRLADSLLDQVTSWTAHCALQRFMCCSMLKSSAIVLSGVLCTSFCEWYQNVSSSVHLLQTAIGPALLEPH